MSEYQSILIISLDIDDTIFPKNVCDLRNWTTYFAPWLDFLKTLREHCKKEKIFLLVAVITSKLEFDWLCHFAYRDLLSQKFLPQCYYPNLNLRNTQVFYQWKYGNISEGWYMMLANSPHNQAPITTKCNKTENFYPSFHVTGPYPNDKIKALKAIAKQYGAIVGQGTSAVPIRAYHLDDNYDGYKQSFASETNFTLLGEKLQELVKFYSKGAIDANQWVRNLGPFLKESLERILRESNMPIPTLQQQCCYPCVIL